MRDISFVQNFPLKSFMESTWRSIERLLLQILVEFIIELGLSKVTPTKEWMIQTCSCTHGLTLALVRKYILFIYLFIYNKHYMDINKNNFSSPEIDSPHKPRRVSITFIKMLAKHGRNHDFIYVLCCFVVDTIRLIDLVGWRVLTQHEKNGTRDK